jgi:hypothetical protein
MNDVRAFQLKFHRLSDRQADLVGQYHRFVSRYLIAHPPPPLLAGHGNFQTAFRRRRQQSWYRS